MKKTNEWVIEGDRKKFKTYYHKSTWAEFWTMTKKEGKRFKTKKEAEKFIIENYLPKGSKAVKLENPTPPTP